MAKHDPKKHFVFIFPGRRIIDPISRERGDVIKTLAFAKIQKRMDADLYMLKVITLNSVRCFTVLNNSVHLRHSCNPDRIVDETTVNMD